MSGFPYRWYRPSWSSGLNTYDESLTGSCGSGSVAKTSSSYSISYSRNRCVGDSHLGEAGDDCPDRQGLVRAEGGHSQCACQAFADWSLRIRSYNRHSCVFRSVCVVELHGYSSRDGSVWSQAGGQWEEEGVCHRQPVVSGLGSAFTRLGDGNPTPSSDGWDFQSNGPSCQIAREI
ncbi:hypothetical protein MRB53_036337 [Persea americana]|nr:hypothetical protein MRB53_036404 [Persea americana]KAJ8614924.1 hypothetical protein MRB53_036337 [Persea americana]